MVVVSVFGTVGLIVDVTAEVVDNILVTTLVEVVIVSWTGTVVLTVNVDVIEVLGDVLVITLAAVVVVSWTGSVVWAARVMFCVMSADVEVVFVCTFDVGVSFEVTFAPTEVVLAVVGVSMFVLLEVTLGLTEVVSAVVEVSMVVLFVQLVVFDDTTTEMFDTVGVVRIHHENKSG